MYAYRKLQHAMTSKTIEYGVPVVIVNPRTHQEHAQYAVID
ncbi:MAG: hypothetical protein RXN78_07340 [Vulcanisaeta sp.]